MRARPVRAAVTAAVLLALGAGVAYGLSAALGLRTEPVTVPLEHLTVAPETAPVSPPPVGRIEVPDDPRLSLASRALRVALGPARGETVLHVEAGDDEQSETYRLTGAEPEFTISADGPAGAAAALYDLADRARSGRDLWADLGRDVTPDLSFRMVDLGAVGVTPDAAQWRAGTDYSHASRAFEDVVLPGPPYVDQDALASARADFDAFVEHALASGYNAVAFPGLVEYLTFDRVDGVYADGDAHVAQARAMREAFAPFWKHAHDLGLRVYLRTDMLALTTPLEEYFDSHDLATKDAGLWDVYAQGLDELYEAVPEVDGVLIRIGEAGRVYDVEGWDYYSQLAVTSVEAVRAMLTTLVTEAERADREVIFRSWSVGVGAVGDMHTNKDSYRQVLDGIDSDRLIVSTKYSLGDFYSHLPLNDTLESGSQRRIVELQSRREFEGSGALPNDLADLYAQALSRFRAANPRVEGIWTWTQDGGPWRAGPMSLELKTGFWQLYELNTYAAARLARDTSADPAEITASWARTYLSDDPATVRAIGEAMALSREAVTTGLYIGPFADQRVFALGLEPPPMMWIFEWDILTGDSAVLDVVYSISRDRLDEAIGEGEHAVSVSRRMHDLIAGTDPDSWKRPELRDRFTATLAYQSDLFEVLASYRAMVLRHSEWLDTGSHAARAAWSSARADFVAAADRHDARYAGDLDLPAYNLTAARIGLERADRDLPMAWAARGALLAVLAWMAWGVLRRGSTARAQLIGAVAPWRAADLVPASRAGRAALVFVPATALVLSRAVFTWFAAPAHLVLVLGAWLAFVAVIVIAVPRAARLAVLTAVGGVALLRTALLLAVLSSRGPGRYWLMMWTEPAWRTLYVTVAFALFAWVLVAAGWAAAPLLGGRRAAGSVALGAGITMLLLGGLITLIGLEDAMSTWNDQLALLPWGLARILGLTVYLGIPSSLPLWITGVGGLVALLGLVSSSIHAGRR